MKKVNPLLIIVLAIGVFSIITTEMGIVGVLPQVAHKFHISASQAGWLVSIFAFVVALSGPFLTLLASGMNRKTILLIAVLMFAISNVVYAFTTHFSVMLAFRIIPALFHPVFFSVALVTAAKLVPPEKSGNAVTKVFSGITVGFAFGVPLTSYLAAKISMEAAFLLGAAVSAIAFVGIFAWLPSLPAQRKMSYGKQLGILRKPQLWLNIAAVIFIFAAMFSTYSYFAEYLGQITRMNGDWISIMLMAFGIIMIWGNFLFGGWLQKSVTKTVILFPLLFTAIYLLMYFFGPYFVPMAVIVLMWGTIHSGGLIVSQTWLARESKEAPEFGNSLFVSFSNLGITIGAAIGGWIISEMGIHQLMWSGIAFALLAFILILIKLKIYGPLESEKA
ncbi:MFS transporter [Paenibacillus thiaminolyticus]|uniref:MFS transporter n=1 Tax=Paenibacillus thiaminolyticus TaxID=49283 RepID=A0AAP9J3E9_PANTH|nr:MFS transporter [Paenibacillus thiaminolyticus]MCY9534097.1 MFS transporter [Paenibacillus thiaminolyticus]MCY9600127.1 MFS transporter [Paenibacillus thiaminolyticus]MCY9608493.1 MFS transporter [Paenibacillus thiaminolyticus]MCY9615216.1 MFS transporter [Paenibacillus thiaminolyticus]MCY9620577.1 MFS transporter [Paenibacillus thiaminolyticus]